MQRSEHRSITRYGLQQVYPELTEVIVKKLERAASKAEGYRKQKRNPERYALRNLYAEQEESRELLALILQEQLLQLADYHQQNQRSRMINCLGTIMHLLQEIAYHTNLFELDEQLRSEIIDELIEKKRISSSIGLYAISRTSNKGQLGIIPEDWSAEEIEQRKDLALSITIDFLRSMTVILESL